MSGSSKNNKTRHAKAMGSNNTSTSEKTSVEQIEPRKTSTQTNTKTNTETNKETDTATKQLNSNPTENKNTTANKSNTQSTNGSNEKVDSSSIKKKHGIAALIIIGTTILVGIVATLLGGKLEETVIKPPAYAPDWLFPVVWSIIYIAIGISAYIAYILDKDKKKRQTDLILYGIHLFFNLMWPLFYFTLDWLIFSSIWLGAVVITAIVVTYRYYKSNLASGIIFTIYTLWLIYALYLNIGIAMLNV